MKPGIENHPAVRLGQFLKEQRIEAELTLRDAAAKLEIDITRLSELERGIGDHLDAELYVLMQATYRVDDETYILEKLCTEVQASTILRISDIYKREELLPAFKVLTNEEEVEFLKTVGWVE